MSIGSLSAVRSCYFVSGVFQAQRSKEPPAQAPKPEIVNPTVPEKPPIESKEQKESLLAPTPVLDGFNAMEAYFSWDGKRIIFQGADNAGRETPLQVYTWEFAKEGEKANSPKCWTSSPFDCECTFFSSDGQYVVFNTRPREASSKAIDFGGYPYSYDSGKEIFLGRIEGDRLITERLTKNSSYEAETSFSPTFVNRPGYPKDGVYLLFTSSRSGSLDLYIRRILDSNGHRMEIAEIGQGEAPISDQAIQITNTPTLQEGGAFFMPDGRIVYRAWEFDPMNPQKDQWERDRTNYRPMQLYLFDPITGEHKQLTKGNIRHWAPYPHPDGEKIVFAKRDFSEENHNFDIFVLHLEDGRQERITQGPDFDGYPVFHPKGDLILFSRYVREEHRFQLMQVPYRNSPN